MSDLEQEFQRFENMHSPLEESVDFSSLSAFKNEALNLFYLLARYRDALAKERERALEAINKLIDLYKEQERFDKKSGTVTLYVTESVVERLEKLKGI